MSADSNAVHDPIGGLYGLRALAALGVFGVHFQQLSGFELGDFGPFQLSRLLTNGNTGVALFFTLSGFLLSIPFWRARRVGLTRPSTRRYLLRRFARIVPLYYLCLTALLLAHGSNQSTANILDALAHYTFVFNYSNEYFYSINPPFWTIAVEMQFYLLLPGLFVLLTCCGARLAATLVGLLAMGCYFVHLWILADAQDVIVFAEVMGIDDSGSVVITRSLLAHLPHFLIGVIAAQFFEHSDARPEVVSRQMGWSVVFWCNTTVVLLIIATPLDEVVSLPGGRYNMPVVPICLALMILSVPRTGLAMRILESPCFRWLGVISYGIYLFHLPLLKLVARTMPFVGANAEQNWIVFASVSLLGTILLASISYVVFERPVMSWIDSRIRPRESNT